MEIKRNSLKDNVETVPCNGSTRNLDETESQSTGSIGNSWSTISTDQKFTVLTFCLANFVVSAFYALLAPFFPSEAAKKGAGPVAVGIIFAIFQFTIGVSSPILGSFITHIGAKFMYTTGVMVCGFSAILFGFLDRCPDGSVYITMCLVVRTFEALGASAFYTAGFAIIAHIFPNNVAVMFGGLELFTGLGFMIGPVIGGGLFELGGFTLPFVCLGSVVCIIGAVSIFLLPVQNVLPVPREGSVLDLIRLPIILIVGLCLVTGTAALGFLDTTLSTHLKNTYKLSPFYVGCMFLVMSGVYALTAPCWGRLSDKYQNCHNNFVCFGFALAGLSLFLMGPVPFLHIGHHIWLQITSSALMGLGLSTLVIAFPVFIEAAVEKGYPDGLATYGLAAGLFNAFFSLGACVGPLVGGFLTNTFQFETSAAFMGGCEILSALILLVYICWHSCRQRHRNGGFFTEVHTPSEKQLLLPKSISHTRKNSLCNLEQH